MFKNSFFVLFFIFITFVSAQERMLSPEAEISVLTIGPGTLLNDAFGHSGFRVKDKTKGIDLVFNYGVYDFEAENFYLKFAQGKLDYLIGLNYYEDFLESYIAQNRTIEEQDLNLSTSEKQALFDYLLTNMKPENQRYLYDFFYDNCATKIKDVLQDVLNNTVVFHEPQNFETKTFRILIHENVKRNTWGAFGIDLALGSVIDKIAPPQDHMFLPKNIHAFFEEATIAGSDKKLVKNSRVIFKQLDTPAATNFLTSPLMIMGVLGFLIVFITYKDFKNNKRSVWLDTTLFTFTGLVGIMVVWLWFATDHSATHQNYNLLWAFLPNLFVMGQLFKEKTSPWFIKYLKFLVILLCLLTLHWSIGVQVFAIGLIPFLIALFARYVFLIRYLGWYKL
ncbi:DUF4105 domain-containing protein [Mariniflexile ostreae]|uniref:DUF4105 domain-containing protein n=1 Tax=Mariniflexile ostreae TaxID=1520892 RepID=A0ABV5FEX4_9FLAO